MLRRRAATRLQRDVDGAGQRDQCRNDDPCHDERLEAMGISGRHETQTTTMYSRLAPRVAGLVDCLRATPVATVSPLMAPSPALGQAESLRSVAPALGASAPSGEGSWGRGRPPHDNVLRSIVVEILLWPSLRCVTTNGLIHMLMSRSFSLALGAGACALIVAGCGGGGSQSGGTNAAGAGYGAGTPAKSSASGAMVGVARSGLGSTLVDAKGRTLYLFEADKAAKSTCYGACAGAWPPLTTTAAPKAGPRVAASELGTTKRTDGTTEVTYHGHPLYYYAGDDQPGATTGQGLDQFGAEWYVLAPSGNKIDED
jgi:predicted lipoprotein with Yx(FWY)xxD motif